jgi:hypothetical protein
VDNGGYFNCEDAYNPTANDPTTVTVNGTSVAGSGFSANYGGIILLTVNGTVTALPFTYVSSTSGTLGIAVPNGTYLASFPTGCSYNGSLGSAGRAHRFQEETVVVTACSPSCSSTGPTTLTITPPLIHANWSLTQSPEAWSIQANNNVGIKNLLVDASNTSPSSGKYGVDFNDVWNFWISGATVADTSSQGISAYNVAFGAIVSNYVYNAGQNMLGVDPNPQDPSGIDLDGSDILVANNIVQWSRIGIVNNGPASGNVFIGNLLINSFESNGDLWGGMWDGHSNGDDYNLFEHNVFPQAFQDQTHGGKMVETYFRNFATAWESCSNGNCAPSATQKNANLYGLGPLSSNRYGNYVGNIIGTPGVTTSGFVYSQSGEFFSSTAGYAWDLASGNGGGPPSSSGGPIPLDPIVLTSTMWWDNWDAFNNATLACTAAGAPVAACPQDQRADTALTYPGLSNPSSSLPPSFYFSSRPSWWSSSIPFPAIGPDVSGGNVGQCSGTPNTAGAYALLPATSSSQCAGTPLTTGWAGHINAIPAVNCYLNTMGGPPDGTGSLLSFDAKTCYASSVGPSGPAPANPSGVSGVVTVTN